MPKQTPHPSVLPQQALTTRLFIGIFPGGISYADRSQQQHGDYRKIAFLPYDTLKLEIRDATSPLLPMVREDAAKITAKRGEQFAISACGQTITLGR